MTDSDDFGTVLDLPFDHVIAFPVTMIQNRLKAVCRFCEWGKTFTTPANRYAESYAHIESHVPDGGGDQ